MALPSKKDQSISLSAAADLTRNYRQTEKAEAIKAGGFWKENVQNILNQPGCVGLRCYYAAQSDGSPALVLVGINEKGDDMTDGPMTEDYFPCPPYCAASNQLNS